MKRSMQGLFLTERALKKEAERRLGIKDAEGSFGAGLLNRQPEAADTAAKGSS